LDQNYLQYLLLFSPSSLVSFFVILPFALLHLELKGQVVTADRKWI
jgi:hypothetical protein